jgi:hypothetical protein
MSSAAEAELAALFYIAQDACSICVTIEELGHPQPPTAIQTDNECAKGIANNTVKQRRSSNGHAILLDPRTNPTAPVHCPLEAWKNQSGQLLHQASSTSPSSSPELHFFTGQFTYLMIW